MWCCSKRNKMKKKLENATNDIPMFSFAGQSYLVKIVDVYDGDTFTACFEYRGEIIKYKFRCMGYDSPEMKPLKSKKHRKEEKKQAVIAREKFKEYSNCDKDLVVVRCLYFDKYGRILAEVYNRSNNNHVNKLMLENSHGVRYDGKKSNM